MGEMAGWSFRRIGAAFTKSQFPFSYKKSLLHKKGIGNARQEFFTLGKKLIKITLRQQAFFENIGKFSFVNYENREI